MYLPQENTNIMRISILHFSLAVAATGLLRTAAEADPLAVATNIVVAENEKKNEADNPFDVAYAELPYSADKGRESLVEKILTAHDKAGRALKRKGSKNAPAPPPPTECATGDLTGDEVYELLLSTEYLLKEEAEYADAVIQPRFLNCALAIVQATAGCAACPLAIAGCIVKGKITLGAACAAAIAGCAGAGSFCDTSIRNANEVC